MTTAAGSKQKRPSPGEGKGPIASMDQSRDAVCQRLSLQVFDHGGHAQAAGFTVHNDNLDAFTERMRALAAAELDGHGYRGKHRVDGGDAAAHALQRRLPGAGAGPCVGGHGD